LEVGDVHDESSLAHQFYQISDNKRQNLNLHEILNVFLIGLLLLLLILATPVLHGALTHIVVDLYLSFGIHLDTIGILKFKYL
jgi:hypothetical protein